MALLKDRYGKNVNYDDLILIDGKKMILREAVDINMIQIMKFQGYLGLLESEIELVLPYEEAKEKYPEIYL